MRKAGFSLEYEKYLGFAEYPYSPKATAQGIRLHFIIDIYAKRGDQIVLIECGDCRQGKLDYLRKHFKVIHYPFLAHPRENSNFASGVFAEDLGKRLIIA